MIREAIARIVDGVNLGMEEAQTVMDEIMSGSASNSQIGAYLIGMRMKNETVEELAGSALAMRSKSVRINPSARDLIDTCGTGGDGSGSFNVSTVSAFVVAGAGVPVAKHGNRSISSRCGSADVLEALGVDISMTPEEVEAAIDQVGIGFLFAPLYHPAMKHALPARKEVGVRTMFNLLGPLANPAGVRRQVVGVYSPRVVRLVAEALSLLGTERSLVVSSIDGLDEISASALTECCLVEPGKTTEFQIDPRDYGIPLSPKSAIRGSDANGNAELAERILRGENGPARDVVLLNAGAALFVSGRADSIGSGIEMARESIDSGRAMQSLAKLKSFGRAKASAREGVVQCIS